MTWQSIDPLKRKKARVFDPALSGCLDGEGRTVDTGDSKALVLKVERDAPRSAPHVESGLTSPESHRFALPPGPVPETGEIPGSAGASGDVRVVPLDDFERFATSVEKRPNLATVRIAILCD
jgi:hypothetical protein